VANSLVDLKLLRRQESPCLPANATCSFTCPIRRHMYIPWCLTRNPAVERIVAKLVDSPKLPSVRVTSASFGNSPWCVVAGLEFSVVASSHRLPRFKCLVHLAMYSSVFMHFHLCVNTCLAFQLRETDFGINCDVEFLFCGTGYIYDAIITQLSLRFQSHDSLRPVAA
jgi:hypothetical protein